uniref:histidine kinase n=1 Tax=uncultured Chloroflexota bacterium TaxID=166587 RepID=H5SN37_9CHLR|nr:multi-sensor hybrid histidine kinase [uncultured Chloroflexota bacterium]
MRILILEDHPDDVELILRELHQAGYEPEWQVVQTETDYLAALNPGLDLILADYTLPRFDALQALHLLHERGLDIPFIVITGSISEEVAVECMKQGATDYLLKDRLSRLGPAIKQALQQHQLRREKQQAAEALRQSQEGYRQLVESAPDGLAVHVDGKIVYVNQTGARLAGATKPEELIGRSVLEFVHPDYRAPVQERIEQILNQGQTVPPVEEKFIRLDGSVIDVEVTASPLIYQGRPAVQVLFRDITERKQHEREIEAIARVATALRLASTRAEMLPIILDQLLELLAASGAALALEDPVSKELVIELGRGTAAELTGLHLPPGKGISSHVIQTAQPYVTDDVHHDPHHFYQGDLMNEAQAVACVPLIALKQPFGAFWVSRQHPFTQAEVRLLTAVADIAGSAIHRALLHEQAERLLQQTQHQARQVQQIINTVPYGMVLLDKEQRLVQANTIAQQQLALLSQVQTGQKLTHLAGYPVARLLRLPPEEMWAELEVTGPPRQIFEVEARPIQTGPEAGGWVLSLREVTRSREIQQRAQQQDRLAAVGQLAAGIAHDFNNILTSIIGFAELALHRPQNLRSPTDALEQILHQGQRAAQLIRQVLDFSRQSIIEMKPTDLASLVQETIQLLKRTIPENIQIEFQIDPDQAEYLINGDAAYIQQALTNLAINARDAMPAGGVLKFTLSSCLIQPDQQPPTPELSPGRWITLAVSDTGVGIPAELLPHLFEPFFTTKEVGKGTGLGLAQVYGIIKQHQGEIDVSTRVGEGTTFTIYLPPLTLPEAVPEKEARPDRVSRGQGQTILVVEDDDLVLNVIQAMLESLNYRVFTARSGPRALDIYDQHQDEIVLVLTDVTMPEMGGMALAQNLHQQNPALKVVAMTGYPLEDEDKALFSSPNIVAWIHKPMSLNELAQTLKQALET